MIGHTHEDIDQVFSRVSSHLKKNSVYTLEGEHKTVASWNAYCLCIEFKYAEPLSVFKSQCECF